MASPVEIDLDALLRPLSDARPAGPDLREDLSPDSLYLQIKDARWSARAAERTGFADAEAEATADAAWRKIEQLAPTALVERSKDLEIAAYWIEALTRRRGFAGLRDALRVANGLVERFWDHLYPRPDPGEGPGATAAPLASLNGEGLDGPLPTRIVLVPLTGPSGEHAGLSSWHYQQARDLSKVTDAQKLAERQRAGAVTLEAFETAVRETPQDQLARTVGDVEEALAEWLALSNALSARCGADAPPASGVRDALQATLETLRYVTKGRFDVPAEGAEAPAASGDPASPGGAAAGSAGGPVRTREDAFRALRAAAEYFRRAEPHSPLSYAIEQAVRWGRLSLPELLRELVPNDDARTTFHERVGIREETEPS